VQCEGGSVHFDAFAHRLDHFDDAAGGLRWIDYGLDLDALMLHAFIEGVRSGAAVQPDGEVGYRTLAVVAAAYESAASGVVHPVEPPR
jgi:predicted dehydrogenase